MFEYEVNQIKGGTHSDIWNGHDKKINCNLIQK